ncbi:MBL fold metallo-hydrolase [Candidatus Nanohalobium constans]|uniref:MBL fold metallo-hydrolase n=1 Tax=Candidatus Nanohalobium constans TaxID=2565781 RepID=UPI0012984051|nr:MBL fold metallo-hydrolase [Candidatus Nanohalobium constans]
MGREFKTDLLILVWGVVFLMDFKGFSVEWEGHASMHVSDNGFTVAVDPFSKVDTDFTADIVLITHSDAGHYDEEALESVMSDRTVFVCPESMEGLPFRDTEFLKEGEHIDIYSVEIEAVPMYNEHHTRGSGVGYRFVLDGTSFYVAGDTGLTDEMRSLEKRVDLAFLPIEGEYTMDVDDAVQAAVRIKPQMVVPYHYGEPFFPGKGPEAKEFRAELTDRNIECKILREEEK